MKHFESGLGRRRVRISLLFKIKILLLRTQHFTQPISVRSCCNVYTSRRNDCFWLVSFWCCQNKTKLLLLAFTKLAVSVLIMGLKAKCLLKNCAVYSGIYIEFQLLHLFFLGGGTKYLSKFVEKIARLFRGQIDPLIIFGRGILNFIAGLVQWRGLAQTLVTCPEQESTCPRWLDSTSFEPSTTALQDYFQRNWKLWCFHYLTLVRVVQTEHPQLLTFFC